MQRGPDLAMARDRRFESPSSSRESGKTNKASVPRLRFGAAFDDGRYAGRAGTGINTAELERLWRRLQPLATDKMPLDVPWVAWSGRDACGRDPSVGCQDR